MSTHDAFQKLLEVIVTLTGPEGCPWDRKQTPLTLCDYVVEEAFELVEAIRADDAHETMEELGDVLFLLLFIAHLAEKRGRFNLEDVLRANAAKMIRRHPHVFADTDFKNQEEQLRAWERIKRAEKQDDNGVDQGVFDSLPKGLPPLLRAYRIHSKSARVGFTWQEDAQAEAQLESEWREWREALAKGDAEAAEQEFGDYLFTLVEVGRRKGIKANAALDFANRKFLRRFSCMEEMARAQGKDLADMDMEAMDALWDQAKEEQG
ncbi:MAG: nucleoside triphosphate pyrophosphohydrolase [Desulfovibrionaceae bacterium]